MMTANRSVTLRSDLLKISALIDASTRVLDLGCGDGTLLSYLQEQKGVKAVGVEINDQSVLACVKRGVHVVQQNLEDGIACAICARSESRSTSVRLI